MARIKGKANSYYRQDELDKTFPLISLAWIIWIFCYLNFNWQRFFRNCGEISTGLIPIPGINVKENESLNIKIDFFNTKYFLWSILYNSLSWIEY